MSEHTQESTRILTGFYISVQRQDDLCSQCVHTQQDRVHLIRYINIDSELVQLYSDQIPIWVRIDVVLQHLMGTL